MTLGIKDKRVLKAFAEGKTCVGHKLSAVERDGRLVLDGHWMGGSKIASWTRYGDRIAIYDLGSRAAQTVQKALKKIAARGWFDAEDPSRAGQL